MNEPTYQIVFRGKILGGFDRDQVRANLSRLFKIDESRVDMLLDAPKTVLKAGLGKDAASRYQEALRQAGIMVAVIGEVSATVSSEEPPVTLSAMAKTREIQPIPAPPAAEAPAASGLTLAEPGVQLLPPQVRKRAEIDTSALTLAQPGVVLVEKRELAKPEFDLSRISIASGTDPIDARPKPAAAAIDTSGLSLAEQPPAAEKALTELQKLLLSQVE